MRREPETLALGVADAGRGAAEACVGASAHFDEDDRAVAILHHEIDLARAARRPPGDAELAHQQAQPFGLQMKERAVLGRGAGALAGGPGVARKSARIGGHGER